MFIGKERGWDRVREREGEREEREKKWRRRGRGKRSGKGRDSVRDTHRLIPAISAQQILRAALNLVGPL